MSYILDALKKSDQERKQGEIPSLQTVHADQLSRQRIQSAKRRKMALTLVLCCLALVAVGLWQWQTRPAPQQNSKSTARESVAANTGQRTQPPSPSASNQIASPETIPTHEATPQIIEPVRQKPSQELQATIDAPVIEQPEVVIEPAPLLQPNQAPAPQLPRAASEPGSTLPLLKDLPIDQQKAIPEISLAGHVYSDEPARRMIMINSRIVREGELVGENLRLVRITWDGVILRHINTDFQMKLQ